VTDILRWWLVATILGLIALPYAFRLFRFLPDRGYTLARPFGLLVVVYPLWLLSVLGLVPYTRGGVILVMAALAVGGLALAGRDREALLAHLRAHRGLLLTAEVVFAVGLVGFAALRAYAPAIQDTEKLFEFAFLNGVLRSPHMPPADPWYGGEPMSYYYGGYLVMSVFTKLTGVAPSLAFNLGVAITGGLTALAAFGLGANLVLAGHAPRWRRRPGTGLLVAGTAGVLSVVLLLVIGNLEGAFAFTAAHGWGGDEFYRRLGIEGLPAAVRSQKWYPDAFLSWWHATRLGSQWNVIEFPFFSFMLGDLHAHVMVLPFSLLGFGSVLNLLRSGERLDVAAVRRDPLTVLYLGALAGMLALANSWDQPIFLGLLFAAALVLNVERDGVSLPALLHTVAFLVPIAVLSFVLYVPFFVHLHPATEGIRPVELNHLPPGVPAEAMVFPPHHFLIFWGPLLIVGGAWIVAQAARRRVWRANADTWGLTLLLAFVPLLLWSAAVIGSNRSIGAIVDEVAKRATAWSLGSYWLVHLGVLALIVLGILTLLCEAGRPNPARRAGRVYATLAVTAALALLHVIELFYVKEPTAARTNTLFKFSYSAWLLLATAGGAVVVDVLLSRRIRTVARSARAAWAAATVAVLLLALVYPISQPFNFTNGFRATPTLDGLAALRTQQPDEYNAVMWLTQTVFGRPVVLEAVDGDYSLGGRVSARTGFPTVLGWPFHEQQERGGRDFEERVRIVNQRAQDVETIYKTADPEQARDLLRRYSVDYVYVGSLEKEKYGVDGLAKFEDIGRAVFRQGSVTIFHVGGPALPLGARQ
jgi:YYY domain-containing protein